MTQELPARPDLAHLKKQAKQLLKEYQAGNSEAHVAVQQYYPAPDHFSSLRDAQLVIARSYGYPGWSALSDAVENARLNTLSLDNLAAEFVDLACVSYTGQDSDLRYDRAARLLHKHPELAAHDFICAIVCHNLSSIETMLKTKPSLAKEASGPRHWPPLMYLAYSRLPLNDTQRHSVAIARLLLDHGADPNSYTVLQDHYRFTVLTGVMGEGESGVYNQPPHPDADALARLLLDAGAEPNDSQGLYNTMFTSSGDSWLKLLVSYGLDNTALANWYDADNPVHMFDFLLVVSTMRNFSERVAYLLKLGASPNVRNPYSGESVYTVALIKGHNDIAAQLLAAGATPETLTPEAQFQVAMHQSDKTSFSNLVTQHPEFLQHPEYMQNASPHALTLLRSLGLDMDHQDDKGRTLLHFMAVNGNLEGIKTLLDFGARDDIRDGIHNGIPLGWAHFNQQYKVRDYLLSRCNNTNVISACGDINRLEALLRETPELAKQAGFAGNTPLHVVCNWLGASADAALRAAIIDVLLEHGADINAVNDDGLTPLGLNQQEYFEDNVRLFGERGAQ